MKKIIFTMLLSVLALSTFAQNDSLYVDGMKWITWEFNFDDDYELKDTSSLVYTQNDGPSCETLIVNRFEKYLAPLLNSSNNIEQNDLLEIHVAFRSDDNSAETTYKRTLVMFYKEGFKKQEIARITFFAETIEEDEVNEQPRNVNYFESTYENPIPVKQVEIEKPPPP